MLSLNKLMLHPESNPPAFLCLQYRYEEDEPVGEIQVGEIWTMGGVWGGSGLASQEQLRPASLYNPPDRVCAVPTFWRTRMGPERSRKPNVRHHVLLLALLGCPLHCGHQLLARFLVSPREDKFCLVFFLLTTPNPQNPLHYIIFISSD